MKRLHATSALGVRGRCWAARAVTDHKLQKTNQKRVLSIKRKYGTCDWGRTLFAVERTVIAVPRFHEHTTNNPGLNDSQSLTSPSHRKSETLSANDRKLRGALAARSFDVLGLARPSSTL